MTLSQDQQQTFSASREPPHPELNAGMKHKLYIMKPADTLLKLISYSIFSTICKLIIISQRTV